VLGDRADRERFFRRLVVYGGSVVAVVPAAAWLVMVVPAGNGRPVFHGHGQADS
jgi:hypothetical protein